MNIQKPQKVLQEISTKCWLSIKTLLYLFDAIIGKKQTTFNEHLIHTKYYGFFCIIVGICVADASTPSQKRSAYPHCRLLDQIRALDLSSIATLYI